MKDFLLLKSSLVLGALFLLLLATLFIKSNLKVQLSQRQVRLTPFPLPSPALYPRIKGILGTTDQVVLKAEAAVVMDDDSKVVLFAKNPHLRFSMASTTKIMTALTALDYYSLNDVLTIKTEKVEGAILGLEKGEKMFFEDLLYALLLPSANDAALALAQNYKGGEAEFVKKMNLKAKDFNLENTHLEDPAGLFDDSNYTTAIDLSWLSSEALKNKTFAKIVATKQKVISDVEGRKIYQLKNLNKLLGIDGVSGIKTGFTDEAGGVLSTSKVENGHTLIIVIMKSQERFEDTKKLLELISGNIIYQSIHP